MLSDFVDALAELSVRAAQPKRLDLPDPKTARFLTGNEVVEVEVPEPPRDHKAGSLDDLVALANRFKGAVWYDESAVVLVIDDGGHRCEKSTLALEHSDVFKVLLDLRAKKTRHEQKAFVKLLRIELAGTLDPVVLLNPVRKVKFGTDAVTTGQISRQKESMGREINSRVETDGEVPEEVTLSVPVYKTMGERSPLPVRCTVEVDPAEGTFCLRPRPDELENVSHMAVASVAERLHAGLEVDVPAYYGKP